MKKLFKIGPTLLASVVISPLVSSSISTTQVKADNVNTFNDSNNSISASDSNQSLQSNLNDENQAFPNNIPSDYMKYFNISTDKDGNITYSISDDDLFELYSKIYPSSSNDLSSIFMDRSRTEGVTKFHFYGPIKDGNYRIDLSESSLNIAKKEGVGQLMNIALLPLHALNTLAFYTVKIFLTHEVMHYSHFDYGRSFYFDNNNYRYWTYQND